MITIALAGNPNCGKTTLFNVLTGTGRYVGNWPGVTVERNEGVRKNDKNIKIIDLPGVYSLSPYSPEEIVTRDFILGKSGGEMPDVVLNVIDGTNLERNLYLTEQIIELGLPVVAAVNLADVMRSRGVMLDAECLSRRIGVPVVEISALKEKGIDNCVKICVDTVKQAKIGHNSGRGIVFTPSVQKAVTDIENIIRGAVNPLSLRFYAVKLFERDIEVYGDCPQFARMRGRIENVIAVVEKALDDDAQSIIAAERYGSAAETAAAVLRSGADVNSENGEAERGAKNVRIKHGAKINRGTTAKRGITAATSATEKIDAVLTHRIFALPIFAVIIFSVYYISVTTVGTFISDWAEEGIFGSGWVYFGHFVPGIPAVLTEFLTGTGCHEQLISLVVEGIVGGVGAVLGFVPQLIVLFAFLAFLESCGYMSRVAFISDRLFRRFGLSGKSFIPMIISSGCGVPGIMSSRTVESEADRKITVTTATFIPCSAKLPVIALIAGIIGDRAGSVHGAGAVWLAPATYLLGVGAILVSGVILKHTVYRNAPETPFVMEMPDYRLPKFTALLRTVGERVSSFVKKAGTIILLSSAAVWFLSSYGIANVGGGLRFVYAEGDLSVSVLANIGRGFAFLFAPLGFGEWQSAVAVVTGLIAKENLVSTLEQLYGGDGIALAFTAAAALSFLVFNMLCSPCVAAVGAIRREMGSVRGTLSAVLYQTVFAYVTALLVYNAAAFLCG